MQQPRPSNSKQDIIRTVQITQKICKLTNTQNTHQKLSPAALKEPQHA